MSSAQGHHLSRALQTLPEDQFTRLERPVQRSGEIVRRTHFGDDPKNPCPIWLRGLGFCTRWIGLNLRASQRRVASYILSGVFLRQRIFSSKKKILDILIHVR